MLDQNKSLWVHFVIDILHETSEASGLIWILSILFPMIGPWYQIFVWPGSVFKWLAWNPTTIFSTEVHLKRPLLL